MDKDQVKKIRRKLTLITIIIFVVVFTGLTACVLFLKMSLTVFRIILAIWLVIHIVGMDIIELKLLHQFDDMNAEKKKAFQKYIFVEIVGVMGLAFFMLTIGTETQIGLAGVLVYVILMRFKTDFKREFLGIKKQYPPAGKI